MHARIDSVVYALRLTGWTVLRRAYNVLFKIQYVPEKIFSCAIYNQLKSKNVHFALIDQFNLRFTK